MIPFTARLDSLRDKMLEYIRDFLNIHQEIAIRGDIDIHEENNGEFQTCIVERIVRTGEAEFLVEHIGNVSEKLDVTPVGEINSDTLAILCDCIQYKLIRDYGTD